MQWIRQYIAYVRDNPEGYWFKRRLYGWGWVPATREGWTVIALYVALLLLLALQLDTQTTDREVLVRFVAPLVLGTAVLLLACFKKGEKPRWSWGIPEKYKEK